MSLYKKIRQLEAELEAEKDRFNQATRRAAKKFQNTVTEEGLIRSYPIETAIVILFTGYLVARRIHERRIRD